MEEKEIRYFTTDKYKNVHFRVNDIQLDGRLDFIAKKQISGTWRIRKSKLDMIGGRPAVLNEGFDLEVYLGTEAFTIHSCQVEHIGPVFVDENLVELQFVGGMIKWHEPKKVESPAKTEVESPARMTVKVTVCQKQIGAIRDTLNQKVFWNELGCVSEPGIWGTLYFVDLCPEANWAHPCLYIFDGGHGQIFCCQHQWPPQGAVGVQVQEIKAPGD